MVSELPKQLLVFIVDEEYILASTWAHFLCLEGLDARSFAVPLEALNAAHTSQPDLLVSDVALGPLSGDELARMMRENCPGCKVLLFSSFAHTDHLLESVGEAGSDFALLPSSMCLLNLMETIQNLIHTRE
jgi:DNA-binding NtrC family response regulator